MSYYDYDIDVNIPTTVRLDNGNVLDLKLTSKILNDSTLDRIFQDIDDFLENEFQGGDWMMRRITGYKVMLEYTWDNGDTDKDDISHMEDISPRMMEALLDDIEFNDGEGDGEYD